MVGGLGCQSAGTTTPAHFTFVRVVPQRADHAPRHSRPCQCREGFAQHPRRYHHRLGYRLAHQLLGPSSRPPPAPRPAALPTLPMPRRFRSTPEAISPPAGLSPGASIVGPVFSTATALT